LGELIMMNDINFFYDFNYIPTITLNM
jgi:hypothetical protein